MTEAKQPSKQQSNEGSTQEVLPQKEVVKQLPIEAQEKHIGLAAAASKFLAWHMEQDGHVQRFREAFSEGRLLGEQECWECLTASMLATMSFNDFEEMGILPVNAVGHLVENSGLIYPESNGGQKVQAEFEMLLPDGGTVTKKVDKDYEPNGPEEVLAQTLYSRVSYRPSSTGLIPANVPYYQRRGSDRRVESLCYSVISEALSTADFLSDAYRIDLWDALRFLLTGIAPDLEPVTGREVQYTPIRATYNGAEEDVIWDGERFRAAGPMGLMVQPWVMPEELAQYWRDKRAEGARKRAMPPQKDIDLFQFVLDNAAPGPESKQRWQKLSNRLQTEQGIKCTGSKLQKVFQRVGKALFPEFEALSGVAKSAHRD